MLTLVLPAQSVSQDDLEELEDFDPDGQLNMPVEIAREQLEKSVRVRLKLVQEKVCVCS